MTGPSDGWDGPSGETAGSAGPVNLGRAVVIIAVAIVLGVLLLQVGSRPVTNPQGTSAAASSGSTTTTRPPASTTTTIARASVHVLVANGTPVPEGATDYTDELQSQGWATLPPADTSSPVSGASTVYYAAGKQADAGALASALGLKSTAVQPLSSSVPVANVSGADVVLVLGPDLANNAPSTTSTT